MISKKLKVILLINILIGVVLSGVGRGDEYNNNIYVELKIYGIFENEIKVIGNYKIGGVKITKETDRVPLVIGTNFGIVCTAKGLIPKKEAILRYQIIHPEYITPNGERKRIKEHILKLKSFKDSIDFSLAEVLSEKYMMVPGEWVFTVLQNDKAIIEKKFYLVQ